MIADKARARLVSQGLAKKAKSYCQKWCITRLVRTLDFSPRFRVQPNAERCAAPGRPVTFMERQSAAADETGITEHCSNASGPVGGATAARSCRDDEEKREGERERGRR